jgi:hypothetical protein
MTLYRQPKSNHVKNLFQQHYDIFLFTIQEREEKCCDVTHILTQ